MILLIILFFYESYILFDYIYICGLRPFRRLIIKIHFMFNKLVVFIKFSFKCIIKQCKL